MTDLTDLLLTALRRERYKHEQYRSAWREWDSCGYCNQLASVHEMTHVPWPCPTAQTLDRLITSRRQASE